MENPYTFSIPDCALLYKNTLYTGTLYKMHTVYIHLAILQDDDPIVRFKEKPQDFKGKALLLKDITPVWSIRGVSVIPAVDSIATLNKSALRHLERL